MTLLGKIKKEFDNGHITVVLFDIPSNPLLPSRPPFSPPSLPVSRLSMETPLSTRRITRSHKGDSTAHFSRTKNAAGERAALHDISNESPIVGLAAGGLHADKTPASTAARPRRTPGSGEALLRGQVKTLLQKVDEEACAIVRPARIQALLGVSRSPAQLLAPTPANTPQLGTVSAGREDFLLPDDLMMMPCVLEEEQLLPKLQVIAASLPPPPPPEENLGECQLNRALVFDDPRGKSDLSSGSVVSSSLSFQGSSSDRSPDDDSSSAWSIQVHASSEKGDEELGEDTVRELEEEEYAEEDHEWQGHDDDCFDDLCEGMSKIAVFDDDDDDEPVGLPAFEGKHTRFIYNSYGEMEQVKVDAAAEHGALVLRGPPVPEGKHLRFHEEEEEL